MSTVIHSRIVAESVGALCAAANIHIIATLV